MSCNLTFAIFQAPNSGSFHLPFLSVHTNSSIPGGEQELKYSRFLCCCLMPYLLHDFQQPLFFWTGKWMQSQGSCLLRISVENLDVEELLKSSLASESHGTARVRCLRWSDASFDSLLFFTVHQQPWQGQWQWSSSVVREQWMKANPERTQMCVCKAVSPEVFTTAFIIRQKVRKWLIQMWPSMQYYAGTENYDQEDGKIIVILIIQFSSMEPLIGTRFCSCSLKPCY